ncbi:MAG: hypothetical protein QXS54_12210 [Candidatus Methanomethylicaceae archaeon]
MFTYFNVSDIHVSQYLRVSFDWIRKKVSEAEDIIEAHPDVNTVVFDCWCALFDDELEWDYGFSDAQAADEEYCHLLVSGSGYFQLEQGNLRSSVYNVEEVYEPMKKSAIELLRPKVQKEIENGALPRHALRSVIYDVLSDEDTRAWHEGKLTILVEAILDLIGEYGFSELQIYGVKEPRQGESPLEVVVVE